jgi:hypothetical protein
MNRRGRVLLAVAIGMGITVVAALQLPYLELLAAPGVFLASAVGAGTVHEPGLEGPAATVVIIWLGTLVVWIGVAYAALALLGRQRVA